MKRTVILMLMPVMILLGCGEEEGVTPQERIQKLEASINSGDYLSFLECFDETASSFSSYTVSQFDSLINGGSVKYVFALPLVIGNTATCTAVISDSGSSAVRNESFTFIERDGDSYIYEWYENGTLMFKLK